MCVCAAAAVTHTHKRNNGETHWRQNDVAGRLAPEPVRLAWTSSWRAPAGRGRARFSARPFRRRRRRAGVRRVTLSPWRLLRPPHTAPGINNNAAAAVKSLRPRARLLYYYYCCARAAERADDDDDAAEPDGCHRWRQPTTSDGKIILLGAQ